MSDINVEGKRSFIVAGTKFEIDRRYELIKPIGHGAYGVVVSAKDIVNKTKVAIKKVPRAFDDLIDAKRILREIKLLRHFNHENVISLKDILKPPSLETFDDVYIISDLMETDLHRIIYSKQKLSDDHVQFFVYQMIRSLKYMHSAGVLHRDLKPSNLLLNSNCDLKVCDFGLARGVIAQADQLALTEYVVTRWYRAPEIMLSCNTYTYAIDVWSVGCILGELLGRKPMFPGEDYIHQLTLINQLLGTPNEEDLEFIESEKAKKFMRGQEYKARVPLATLYPKANPLAVDLLEKMLIFNPAKRISVVEALAHPYMASLSNPDDEPECPTKFEFENESDDLNKEMLQELIWKEMSHFHPEAHADLQKRENEGKLAIASLRRTSQQ